MGEIKLAACVGEALGTEGAGMRVASSRGASPEGTGYLGTSRVRL